MDTAAKKITPTPLGPEDREYLATFNAMRVEMGHSPETLALDMALSSRIVRWYVSGERIIPPRVRRTMELLYQEFEMKKLVGTAEAANV